ncbi:MAG: ATP-grasp domain-containing protein [Methylomarinum sp.]|nr:ATP-grasp domain-containing protein [Methylomarinum sp.]
MNVKLFSNKLRKGLFFVSQLIVLYLDFKPRLRIIFSNRNSSWKSRLQKGFRFTHHQIVFEEITAKNIANYDLIIPSTIKELKNLNNTPELIRHNLIPIPSLESIEICDDKKNFFQTLSKNGFGKYLPQTGGKYNYPYLLKKRNDEAGKNSYIISNEEQKHALSEYINNPDYFSQELVSGKKEYATHILFKDNKVAYSITIKYNFEHQYQIHGKVQANYSELIKSSPYLDVFTDILRSIKFEGLCCIDYKVIENSPIIFEINPRSGISLCPFFFSILKVL